MVVIKINIAKKSKSCDHYNKWRQEKCCGLTRLEKIGCHDHKEKQTFRNTAAQWSEPQKTIPFKNGFDVFLAIFATKARNFKL